MNWNKLLKRSLTVIISSSVLLFFVLLAWYGLFQESFYETFSKLHWTSICSKVNSGNVSESELLIPLSTKENDQHKVILEHLDKNTLIQSLTREVGPPTPSNIIYVKFSNHSTLTLYNWGSNEFAIRFLNSYYIISNDDLYQQVNDILTDAKEDGRIP